MPGTYAACAICGGPISDEERSRWMSEFRALYTENLDWTDVRLSGIGAEDPELDQSTLVDLWLFKGDFRTTPIAVPSSTPQTAWGFPFHASCWGLFVKLQDDKDVDIKRLFNILLSTPLTIGCVDWGHDYGHLMRTAVDVSLLLPGEERVLGGLDYDNLPRNPAGIPIYTFDPLAIPELLALRDSCSRPCEHTAPAQTSIIKIRTKSDSFDKLPAEIMQMVLNILPSKDVLHLKLASSVVAAMPLAPSFWASRFLGGHEFEYIVEARHLNKQRFSWEKFYLGVKNLHEDASLKNRQRISKLIFPLRDLLLEPSLSTCFGTPLRSFFEPNAAHSNQGSWKSASRAVVDPKEHFGSGCRALRHRQVRCPNMITAVFISFIEFAGQRYISGIRVQQHDEGGACLGYIRRDQEYILDSSCGVEGLVDVSGFVVAMDLRGMRGISLLTKDGASKWIGDHQSIPKKRLMNGAGRVQLLKAEFDAMKMVSLAVPEDLSASPARLSSLRDEAFWLPVVPPEGLLFNDHFRNDSWVVRQHWPYNMILFGGCHGENLSKLVEVVVWMVGFGRIYGIDFRYNAEVDGRKIHTLGRRGPFSDAEPRQEVPLDASGDRRISFEIDGPGGEKISHIYLLKSKGQLDSFRLCTNRGRDVIVSPPYSPTGDDQLPFVLIDTAQTEIVGLYAILRTGIIFSTLGVISREVAQENSHA